MKYSPDLLISTKRARSRFEILENIFQQIGDERSRIVLLSSRGHDVAEIARKLNIPEPLAHRQLAEAQHQVRQLINKYYA